VQSFTFQVREGADLDHVGSNVGPTATTTAGNDTNVMFNFKYVPGMYQFCELNIMPGVTPTFTLNGMILPYFVPNGNDPLADNSTVCVNFTIGAGATAAFSVENTPPGFAHTIGFWKNWSSCPGDLPEFPGTGTIAAAEPAAADHGRRQCGQLQREHLSRRLLRLE
jgi:hypothetical protein